MSNYSSSNRSRRGSGQVQSPLETASYALMEPVTAVASYSAVKVGWNSALRIAAMTANFVTADETVTNLMQQNSRLQQTVCSVSPQPTKYIYAEDIQQLTTQTSTPHSACVPARAMTWPQSPTTAQMPPPAPLDLTINHDKQRLAHGRSQSAISSHISSPSYRHHPYTMHYVDMPPTDVQFYTEQQQQQQRFYLQQPTASIFGYLEADAMSAASLTAAQQACAAQHLAFTNQMKTAWLQLDIDALKRLSHDYWLAISHTYSGAALLEWMPLRSLLIDMDLKLYKLLIDAMVPVPEIDAAYQALSDQDFANMHSFLTTALCNVPQAYRPLPMSLQTPLVCAFVAFCRTAVERLELVFAVKTGLETLESCADDIGMLIERLLISNVSGGGGEIVGESAGDGDNPSRHAHQQQQQRSQNSVNGQHSESTSAGASIHGGSSSAASRSSSTQRSAQQSTSRASWSAAHTTRGNNDENISSLDFSQVVTDRARHLTLQLLQQLASAHRLSARLSVESIFAACETIISGLMATFQPFAAKTTTTFAEHPSSSGGTVDQQKLFSYLGGMPQILQSVANDLIRNATVIITNGTVAAGGMLTITHLRTALDMLCMVVRFMCDLTHEQMQQIDNPIVSSFVANLLNQTQVLKDVGLVLLPLEPLDGEQFEDEMLFLNDYANVCSPTASLSADSFAANIPRASTPLQRLQTMPAPQPPHTALLLSADEQISSSFGVFENVAPYYYADPYTQSLYANAAPAADGEAFTTVDQPYFPAGLLQYVVAEPYQQIQPQFTTLASVSTLAEQPPQQQQQMTQDLAARHTNEPNEVDALVCMEQMSSSRRSGSATTTTSTSNTINLMRPPPNYSMLLPIGEEVTAAPNDEQVPLILTAEYNSNGATVAEMDVDDIIHVTEVGGDGGGPSTPPAAHIESDSFTVTDVADIMCEEEALDDSNVLRTTSTSGRSRNRRAPPQQQQQHRPIQQQLVVRKIVNPPRPKNLMPPNLMLNRTVSANPVPKFSVVQRAPFYSTQLVSQPASTTTTIAAQQIVQKEICITSSSTNCLPSPRRLTAEPENTASSSNEHQQQHSLFSSEIDLSITREEQQHEQDVTPVSPSMTMMLREDDEPQQQRAAVSATSGNNNSFVCDFKHQIDREVDDDDDDDDDAEDEDDAIDYEYVTAATSCGANLIAVNTLDLDGSIDLFTDERI